MGQPIREVTIVGGGTAGWMTALLLQSMLKGGENGVRITLIESPNIPTVGVGEATVPGMPRTLRQGGIDERAFFRTCNASFKLGVVFGHWNEDAEGKRVDYINPFAHPPAIDGVSAAEYALQFGTGGLDFVQTFSPSVDLAAAAKGPRGPGEMPGPPVGFAYHLDAGKFAGMLKEHCVARGVRHVLDDLVEVELDECGYVAALMLERGGRHPVELVIDCTGFRGLIINQALGEPFESYGKYLANDRAMAVQVPHREPERLDSVTKSTALGAGWAWRVPLFNRIGTGYVFSSAHRTDEEAREEFLAHLGPDGEGAEPRVIPMRVGRNRNAWVKNCVAVGLSGGFIEPLESTAIHMIDTAVRWLVQYFPDTDYAEPLRGRFNHLVDELYNEVRDFICLHYALGNRTDDQYWIDAREELEVPDTLAENLELWQYGLPAHNDIRFVSLFSPMTYQAVLLGKRVYETGFGKGKFSTGRTLDPAKWEAFVKRARAGIGAQVQAAAGHRALLRAIRGEAGAVAENGLLPGLGGGAGAAKVGGEAAIL
ncbi:tryptophan halogenase family protein [Vannielia litorea]|uniref:tryptophan halogenase family protein n=1 Tax=Vannielia litorea TaxID=1217970 RepID=UPI001C970299|nr:tryptophan halogenase family protein [Vannielia litorea]MBY6049133.1 tryptophan 7-halogenase [Vannielia litorea]MBY6076547.1 tryptophan 7-halogenase [Vannielia litorea]